MKFLKQVLGLSNEDEVKEEVKNFLDQQVKAAEENTTPQQTEEGQPLVCVSFIANEHGSLSLDINWSEGDDSLAEVLGTLLHYISTGKLGPHCESIILKHMKERPSDAKFLKSVLHFWQNNHRNHEHIVKPSEVFKLGQDSSRPNNYGKEYPAQ